MLVFKKILKHCRFKTYTSVAQEISNRIKTEQLSIKFLTNRYSDKWFTEDTEIINRKIYYNDSGLRQTDMTIQTIILLPIQYKTVELDLLTKLN